jgi:drug/metabolite transporter (DMT)-like permease
MSSPASPVSHDAASVRRATLIGLVAVLCWSSTVGLIRSVSEALGALGGAAMLYSVSAALLLAVRACRAAQLRSVSKVYLGCGLLFVLYEICLSVAIGLAQDRAQSMELGMINYLWPSLTIVLAVLCRQQARWLWPGVALCIWGLVRVLSGDGAAATCPGGRPAGPYAQQPAGLCAGVRGCCGRCIRCCRASTAAGSTAWACSCC